MEAALIETLLKLGAAGIVAAFSIYLLLHQEKQHDAERMVWKTTLNEKEKQAETYIKESLVLLRDDITSRAAMTQAIRDVERRLDAVEKRIESLEKLAVGKE